MNKGDVLKVTQYRDNQNPTIKIGVVDNIRDIHTEELKLKTYQKYVITRSQYLITLKDSEGNCRSYYDKFLTYQPVNRLERAWLNFRGKI